MRKDALHLAKGVVTSLLIVVATASCADQEASPTQPLHRAPSTAAEILPGGLSYGWNVDNVWPYEYGQDSATRIAETVRFARLMRHSGAAWGRVVIRAGDYWAAAGQSASVNSAAALNGQGIAVFATLMWSQAEVPDSATWDGFVRWAKTNHPSAPAFGIWNEPNCQAFFPGSTTAFDMLYRIAYRILKEYPAKTVVMASFSDHHESTNGYTEGGCVDRQWLLGRLAKADTANMQPDVVGIQDYINPAESASDWISLSGREVWVTETGWNEANDQTLAGNAESVLAAMESTTGWTKTFFFQFYNAGPDALNMRWLNWDPGYGSTLSFIQPRKAYQLFMARACSGTDRPCTPIARWYNSGAGSHLYSDITNEADNLAGWQKQASSAFYTATVNFDGTLVPLYRCYQFLAHSLGVSGCSVGSQDRFLGYISADSLPGMRRLVQYYRASDTDYLTVSCPSESIPFGFTSPQTLGYAYVDPTYCTASPSAPPTLSASISGLNPSGPGFHTFTASVTGGTGYNRYRWFRYDFGAWGQVGSEVTYSTTYGTGQFIYLVLEVTSGAQQDTALRSFWVP